LVICAGGGGVPVVEHRGVLRGVEAVIDKDLAACLLACELGADALLLLTDVPGVEEGFACSEPHVIRQTCPAHLRGLELPAGSMGPKAEAACRFVEATGRVAVIAALEDALVSLDGMAGTRVVPERLIATAPA
jgi:carbamate kinase